MRLLIGLAILDHKDKPIISLLEGLKFYITNRIEKMKDLMSRWRTSSLCPMIQQKLEVVKKLSDYWTVNLSGDEAYSLFEVSRDNDKFVVNLVARECSCRRSDPSGIPCVHSVACRHNHHVPENYVDIAYR